MRIAIYARVSTSDKDQNPETQILPPREFCQVQGWPVVGVFIDEAPAGDLARRSEWRRLLDLASRRRFDLLLVWRLDRMSRSVVDAANTLERLRAWGVGLRSLQEPWIDTTSPFGEAMFHITMAFAQLERGVLRERVKAGMQRARREGRQIGRPGGTRKRGFDDAWGEIGPRILAGEMSIRQAADALGVSRSTVGRLLGGGPKGVFQ